METAHRRTGLFDDELARLWRSPAPVAEDTEPTASVPHGRPRDEADLEVVLPLLHVAAVRWLAEALAAWDVSHPWLARARAQLADLGA